MRDGHDTVHTEQRRAAVVFGVDPVFQGAKRIIGEGCAEFPDGRGGEFILEPAHHSQRQALAGLEDYIADKAIADHDIEFLAEQVVSLHVADEIQVESTAQLERLQRKVVTLGLLGADAQQPHPRPADSENFPRINVTHDGVVHQVPGFPLDVGPGVEQDEVTCLGRHHGGDARAIDAGQGAQLDAGCGDHPTGVAGGEDGVRLAVLDQIRGHGEGAFFFAAQSLDRLFLHREYLRRVDYLDARSEMPCLAKRGADGVLVADEVHCLDGVVPIERL